MPWPSPADATARALDHPRILGGLAGRLHRSGGGVYEPDRVVRHDVRRGLGRLSWHAGVVFSVFEFSGGLGAMIFPYLTGPIAAGWGFRAALASAAAPACVVALLALYLRGVSGEMPRQV